MSKNTHYQYYTISLRLEDIFLIPSELYKFKRKNIISLFVRTDNDGKIYFTKKIYKLTVKFFIYLKLFFICRKYSFCLKWWS